MEVLGLIIRWVLIITLGLLALAFVSSLSAQENSVVTIESEYGGIGQAVVVKIEREHKNGFIALVATAAHIFDPLDNDGRPLKKLRTGINTEFRGIKGYQGVLVSNDTEKDLAIVRVWVPSGVVALDVVEVNESCLVQFARRDRLTSGKVSVIEGDKAYADAELAPGDSGGAVMKDGKLAGIISGGWFWIKRDGKTVTWPARFGTGQRIKAMLEGVK